MILAVFAGLVVLALGFIFWPLLRRSAWQGNLQSATGQDATQAVLYREHLADLEKSQTIGEINQEQFEQLKIELQRTMIAETGIAETGIAETRIAETQTIGTQPAAVPQKINTGGVWGLMVLALAVPLGAWGVYNHLGAKADWEIYQLLQTQRQLPDDDQAKFQQVTQELLDKARARVEEKPKSPQLIYMLASFAMSSQDLSSAETYYRKLLALEPRSPQILAELAQVLFVKSQNVVTAEVRDMVKGALSIAPNIPTALSLAGIDEFQQGQFQKAIDYWSRALPMLDPQTQGYQALAGGIEKAKASLAAAGTSTTTEPAKASTDSPSPANTASPSIEVAVSIGKAASVSPGDTVFVYARAWQGAKMPLAIAKFPVSELPKTVRLDKSMAMAAGMDITTAPQLEVVARVSKSGSAISAPGDWQAAQGPVTLAEVKAPLTLVIETQLAK
ncbi:MAG: cytochrome c-type biosis protein CcmI [Pseudomonadota bacterium]|jgi:cytochrome c-type biogenesis protein CcmH